MQDIELDITTDWYKKQHTLTIEDILKKLGSNIATGLSEEIAEGRLKKFGFNELSKSESESLWSRIVAQFEDILVRILLVSAVISFFISYFEKHNAHSIPPWVEPCVIFTILILNAIVGVYQDYDAENALESLKNLQTEQAVVLRNGDWKHIESRLLVPGDIVVVKQGDKMPADLRLVRLETTTLRLNQSILTGETYPCLKEIQPIEKEDAILQEKKNTLFSGTTVSNGACLGVVFGTANNTEIGKIHEDLAPPDDSTPLKKRIKEFGDMLAKVIGVICVVIWLMNISNFFDPVYGNPLLGSLYFFKIAVSLAVAAIPEGLPAVITTCMALGTRQMAKKNAIIRKLPSVETLGCTTVICSDKTGTLTTNNMCVKEFCLFGQSSIKNFIVEGETYNTEGKIEGMSNYEQMPAGISKFVDCCIQCNDSKLLIDKHTKQVAPNGLPTEAALKVLAEKIGNYDKSFDQKNATDVEKYGEFKKNVYEKLATLEFSRDRKSMSVLCKENSNSKNLMFIKGAPDYLLRKSNKMMEMEGHISPLDDQRKRDLEKRLLSYAVKGLRPIAIAIKQECGELQDYTGPEHSAHKLLQEIGNYEKLEAEPIILGLAALQDPPRPGVANSIKRCKEAGISIIMITGDIKETAESIAKEIGIIDKNEIEKRSFTGKQFEQFTEEQKQTNIIENIRYPSGLVFSRTEPKHKKALVELLQKNNHIAAMTGDGVNDAPALNIANIGVAMGISGTEVAKDASDMVLADDNFETIVAAVEQGRAIYANMKAFIRYMISSNIGEVVSIFLSSLIGLPDAFNSIQLLWVNLVTDGLPATALSFNPPDPDLMDKPPRPHDEPIVTGWVFFRYMVVGMYVGIVTVGIFIYWYMYYDWAGDNHTLVSFQELKNWSECQNWKGFQVNDFLTYQGLNEDPCGYFTWGKTIPSTLSLSTLVIIEMLNAVNALSEDASLFQVGLSGNPWLILAIFMSVALHFVILYVPFFQGIFATAPLTAKDWSLVLGVSFPVIIIDEILKVYARYRNKVMNQRLAKTKQE